MRQIGQQIKGQFDSVAVSAILGIRNPEDEITVRDLIRELTGLPVVCGHDLTGHLNSINSRERLGV